LVKTRLLTPLLVKVEAFRGGSLAYDVVARGVVENVVAEEE
jgi:hypothetical protein